MILVVEELNTLDLGIRMSLQSAMELSHQIGRDPVMLTTTSETIRKIFDTISTVLQLVVECHGDNIYVEERKIYTA